MPGTQTQDRATLEQLLDRLQDDPWSLSLEERGRVAVGMADAQRAWADRLPQLVEPPAPGAEFPAYLLATGRFAIRRR